MTYKIGRNDPCPCGSGKKYKQCCANSPADFIKPERKGHAGAVERAIDWLMNKHHKAVGIAMDGMLFDELSHEERDTLKAQDQEAWQSIQLNAIEWLLAEGQILVHGERKRVSECLLGQGGPLLTVDQRRWIMQLAERPLRLYDVTEVIPGQQMTLCDSLDSEAPPIIVSEKSGSQAVLLGIKIGSRIMEVDSHYELSGAFYTFSNLTGPAAVARTREAMDQFDGPQEDLPGFLSFIIRLEWLYQFCRPKAIPTFVDTYSGDPILLITDHYCVKDWTGMTESLATQSDVEGDRESGWSRIIDCDDGQIRSAVEINIGKNADRISLFYKTRDYADKGRPWFQSLVGKAVQFVSREVTDPKGALQSRSASQRAQLAAGGSDLPPEAMADLIETALRRIYAKWPDEPILALAGKTPRQAINTPAGLERVKGLIRMYEASEKRQAAQQVRGTVSFDFLWQALGISRHTGSE